LCEFKRAEALQVTGTLDVVPHIVVNRRCKTDTLFPTLSHQQPPEPNQMGADTVLKCRIKQSTLNGVKCRKWLFEPLPRKTENLKPAVLPSHRIKEKE